VRRAGFWLVAFLALSCVPAARAQHPAPAAIVLPPRLVAGQPATLAVLDASGRLAPGTAVEFSGGRRVVTDSTGRARFTAPETPGVLLARLARGEARSAAVVFAHEPGPAPGVRLVNFPRLVSREGRFSVSGAGFAGDADANYISLGGKAALVLAASPASLVLLPNPRASLGRTRLEIDGAAVPATLVTVEVGSPKSRLAPRRRVRLTVRVAGTDLPVELEARNLTPEIVKLRGGNVRQIKTPGGDDNAAGIELEGLRAGDYALEVRLAAGASGLPDVEAARQALLVARQVAPASRTRQLDKMIRELGRHPRRYLRVRDQLERMLPQPSGAFGRALEAAREILGER
jgi:hypothetical protein